jgi:hypothetical protein
LVIICSISNSFKIFWWISVIPVDLWQSLAAMETRSKSESFHMAQPQDVKRITWETEIELLIEIVVTCVDFSHKFWVESHHTSLGSKKQLEFRSRKEIFERSMMNNSRILKCDHESTKNTWNLSKWRFCICC